MGLYDSPLPKETSERMFHSWLSVIRRRECATILTLPKFDRHYRVVQGIEWIKKSTENRIYCVPISFQGMITEEWGEVSSKLKQLQHPTCHTVFFVLDAEWLISAAPHLISHFQSYTLGPYRSVSFIFFFEKNIFESDIFQLFQNQPVFLQNVFYQLVYARGDILHFLHHMETIYGFRISQRESAEIWRQCGGYIWLSTEALRNRHKTDTLCFDHNAMQFRLRAVWEGFSRSEQDLLIKIVLRQDIGSTNHEEITSSYFQKTGLIDVDVKGSWELSVSILGEFIKQHAIKQRRLTVVNNSIYAGTVMVNDVLSSKERAILTYFLKHKDIVIDRPTIAKILWGGQSELDYSDWNLDQAIHRLRDRFASLGLPKHLITTIKGRGFQYTEM